MSNIHTCTGVAEPTRDENFTIIDIYAIWQARRKFFLLDEKKIKLLRKTFIANLKLYGYKSILELQDVTISDETYLPVIEGFDMKFDSSASDNIRAIWAFTIALIQTSLSKSGNHPNILIFDEPLSIV